jgi:hypothetical protein
MNTWAHTDNGLRASRSSILPKHPLKALWNSLSNSVQNIYLEPPIYRLQVTLKNCWDSDSVCRASGQKLATSEWFSVISFQKQRNFIFIWFTSGWLDRVSGRSSLKSLPRLNGTLEYSELLDIVRTCCWVIRTVCKYWTWSWRVAESSGRIGETSKTLSIS